MSWAMKCCAPDIDAHFLPLRPLSLGADQGWVGYTGEQEKELPKITISEGTLRF